MATDKTFGVKLVITETGFALIDQAGNKLKDFGEKAAAGAKLKELEANFRAIQKATADLGTTSDIAFGDFEAATKKASGATQQLLDQVGFISKSQYDQQFRKIAEALSAMERAGVESGPVYSRMIDQLGQLENKAIASGLKGSEALGNLAKRGGDVGDTADRAGQAWNVAGPVVRRAADLASDGIFKATGATAALGEAAKSLGPAYSAALAGAAGVGKKALEEGLETLAQKTIKAGAEAQGFGGKWTALSGALTTGATGVAVGAAAVAGLGVSLYKLTTTYTELKNVQAAAAEAQSRSEEPTRRQIEQMQRMAEAMNVPLSSLLEFKTGRGAVGFAAIVEHAAADPEGRIAANLRKISAAVDEVKAVSGAWSTSDMFGPAIEGTDSWGKKLSDLRERLAEVSPAKLTGEQQALVAVFNEAKQGAGGLSGAIGLYGKDIEDLAVKLRTHGVQASKEFQAAISDADGSAEKAFRELLARLKAAEDEWQNKRREQNKKAVEEATKAWEQAQAAMAKNSNMSSPLLGLRANVGLTAEGDQVVNVNKADPRFAQLEAAAREMTRAATDWSHGFLKAFSAGLSGGNIDQMTRAIQQLQEQGKSIAFGDSKRQDSFDRAANMMERLLREFMQSFGGKAPANTPWALFDAMRRDSGGFREVPGRAGGGPVTAGGMYLVGESGPEILRMGSRGGEVIPAGPTRAAFGGSAEMVAELRALRAEMRVMGSRPTVLNATIEADGKAIAKLVRFHRERNQDG